MKDSVRVAVKTAACEEKVDKGQRQAQFVRTLQHSYFKSCTQIAVPEKNSLKDLCLQWEQNFPCSVFIVFHQHLF